MAFGYRFLAEGLELLAGFKTFVLGASARASCGVTAAQNAQGPRRGEGGICRDGIEPNNQNRFVQCVSL